MRPLLFIPGAKPEGSLQEEFRRLGLGELHRQIDCIPSEGPDGQPGRLFAWLDPKNNQIAFRADSQTWLPASGFDGSTAARYWVGVWNESPPTEEDLRRPDCRRGEYVPLGNGQRWLITTPHHVDRFPVLTNSGIEWAVDEQFNWLASALEKRRAEGLTQSEDGKSVKMSFDDVADFGVLCRVLQINYRITPELVAHLRLFSESAIRETVAALLGLKLV